MRITSLLASAVLLAACAPKSVDTEGDTSSSSAMETSAEATSSTSTPPTSGTDGGGTQAASSTTEESSTSTSTSTGADMTTTTATTTGTDDTGGGALPGACADRCAQQAMCFPDPDDSLEECTMTCLENVYDAPGCPEATAAQLSCVAGLSCQEASDFMAGFGTACSAEAEAYDAACDISGCGGEIGGSMETCELQQECDDSLQRYVCDGGTCTCIEDGVSGMQCPVDQFCESSDEERRAAITACCGWTWMI